MIGQFAEQNSHFGVPQSTYIIQLNIHLILWFNTITCIMYKPLIGYIALYIHCIEI